MLAIIVAAVEADKSIKRCLDALADACRDLPVEIVVVGPETDSAFRAAAVGRRGVTAIPIEMSALTPRMWSEGIAQTSAPVVGLLTAHCFVCPTWARSMLGALAETGAAAGGPIALARDASTVDAAVFFLRYSAYLAGQSDRDVRDIAGDNAAYVREKIPPQSWDRNGGFWEHDVNRDLVARGERIRWVDEAVVEFGSSFTFRSICHHRYEHGRLFGIARVDRGESRLRIIAGFPAVPFVLALRIWRRVSRHSRYRTEFIRCLPVMIAIAFCWAFGEAAGAGQGKNAHRS